MTSPPCPVNINNGTNNILFKLGLLNADSQTLGEDRARLFYEICIPIRILIILGVFSLLKVQNTGVQSILCIIFTVLYLTVIYHLASKSSQSKKCQWWSNNFEIFLSVVAICICIFCYINKLSCIVYIGIILSVSVLMGLLQSFIIRPFSSS